MAANGIEDIYLSYMVVTRRKLDRLVRLAESLRYFATTVDGEANARPLQRAAESRGTEVDVVLEVNLGLDRVGVEPDDAAVSLAEYIDEQSHLRLAGVMGYEGHIGYGPDSARTAEEYTRRCDAAMDTLQGTVSRIEAAGIDVEEVMAGSTATTRYSGRHPAVTEVHPGMYLFNDANLVECTPDVTKRDCAATVVTTVISKPSADRAIVDGGSKTFSLDLDRMPVPKHRDDVRYYNASEEHGWIDTSAAETPVSIGDRVEFVVPHVCTTINLHDRLIGLRNGRVETVWDVQARGKVQ
jgi:D-serine deaminase-like pyridoxal phosphate-dependent protein